MLSIDIHICKEHTVSAFFWPALDLECSGCLQSNWTVDEAVPTLYPAFQHHQSDSSEQCSWGSLVAVELKRHLHPSWPIAGQIRESLNTNSHSLTNFKCLVTFNRTLPGFCLQVTWSLTSEEWKCLQGPDHLIQSIVATQNHCRYLVPAWWTVLYLVGDISS